MVDWPLVGAAWLSWPGVARRLLTFFASPKKVSKERRPLLSATPSLRYGAPCGTRFRRGPRKLASLKQRAALIRLKLRSSAQTQGVGGIGDKNQYQQPDSRTAEVKQTSLPINQKRYELNSGLRPPSLRKRHFRLRVRSRALSPPRSGWACADRAKRDQGRALFERNEVKRVCAAPRFSRSAQVARSAAQGPSQPGRLSFAYFSLAKQRKVSCRRATPGQPAKAKNTQLRIQ